MALIKIWFVSIAMLLAKHCQPKSVKETTKNEHVLDRDLKMSLDAQQTLLDEMGISALEKIKDAVPLYREDLPDDYIAYWQVEYDTEYITVSSGPQTGDYDVLSTGLIPSPTSLLRDKATSRGHRCFRFYVLTSGGEMMCTDQRGQVVATTLPETLIFQNSTDKALDVDQIHDFIKSKAEEQALLWKEQARKVRKHQIDEDIDYEELSLMKEQLDKMAGNTTTESMFGKYFTNRDGLFQAKLIAPGSPVTVVTGKLDVLKEVRIRYIPTGPEEKRRIPNLATHTKLCQIINVCESSNQNYALMSRDAVEPSTGQVSLELDRTTKKVFKGEEFVFAFDIVHVDGAMKTRYFYVEYRPSRQKRSTYSSWSTWSIANEYLFPDYDQFQTNDCAVGCGPVAWSMVFGYYDRRSHRSSSFTGSENLYRSGSDGTYGSSSEVAPQRNDNRMKNYIKKMNSILGTFCIIGQGATMHWNMDNLESFFKQRQTSGSPRIVDKSHWLSFAGIYSDAVASWAKDKIKQRWPVIVGWRDGSYLRWHYPVATQVKSRTKTYKSCFLWFCRTKTSTESQMYLHMGWGGSRNGWKKLEAYYAVTAVY